MSYLDMCSVHLFQTTPQDNMFLTHGAKRCFLDLSQNRSGSMAMDLSEKGYDLPRFCEALKRVGKLSLIRVLIRDRSAGKASRKNDGLEDSLRTAITSSGNLAEDALIPWYKKIRLENSKSVSIYELSSKVHPSSLPLDDLEIDEEYSKYYPLPLPEECLRARGNTPTLSHIEKTSAGTRLIFCSKREYREKEEVSVDELSDDYRERNQSSYQVVVFSKGFFQAFDTLFLPTGGKVALLSVDTIKKPSESRDTLRDRLERRIQSTFHDIGADDEFQTPVNLFPAIKSLYNKTGEGRGRVFELHFTTGNDTKRTVQIRREETDIREEPYHTQGMLAIDGVMDPFHLGICWPSLDGTGLEVRIVLPGREKMTKDHIKNPLIEMQIPESPSPEDLDLVIGKVLAELGLWDDEPT